MVSMSDLKFLAREDADTKRQTTIRFALSAVEAERLLKEDSDLKDIYNKAVEAYEADDSNPVIPYMELILTCSYGEVYEIAGCVDLGIGVSDCEDDNTEIIDTVNLIPGKDFKVEDMVALWKAGIGGLNE